MKSSTEKSGKKTDRSGDEKDREEKWRWYDRGAKIHHAKKFRNGACANCGAMTHDAKSCFERARKVGAKFTGKHIAADEKIESIELDYAGKRDRWNGYDTSQYCQVQEKRVQRMRAVMVKMFQTPPLQLAMSQRYLKAGGRKTYLLTITLLFGDLIGLITNGVTDAACRRRRRVSVQLSGLHVLHTRTGSY
uniref:Pre-mRNA-splicing factor SLU7 n=2 Tax=Brassica oleracea TaxID=3712 RepID=A0A0D3AIL4_BRAOL|nr:unnamed protein product [Brassica oleracea]